MLHFGATRYEITVANPESRSRGIAEIELDGVAVDPSAIPLKDDGATHRVSALIGDPALARSGAADARGRR